MFANAYSPDLPGCIATAVTRADVEREMSDAIVFHLEGLRAEGLQVPSPHSSSTYVDVPA
jgi:predicted RNase H-like HicB family nuclease